MSITAKDVKHIATLSRLNVPADELDKFQEQFNQILNYAEILKKVDTTGIEPSPYVLPTSNVFREDVPQPGVTHEEAMKNAPEEHNGGFKVPRVIE
jgi:aspartyl-tRNA(Asn)/glutamyl-tRNA(Gln) amidotransferase subunit C